MIKYIFEEYDDYNDCEQCGGGSSTCYSILLNEEIFIEPIQIISNDVF